MSPAAELDDVAGHEAVQRHLARLAVAHDGRGHADHRLELGGRGIGPRLLHEPQDHAEHDHERPSSTAARGSPVSSETIASTRQQDHQRVGDGHAQEGQPAVLLLRGHHVRPVLLQPSLHLLVIEARGARTQGGKHRRAVLAGLVEIELRIAQVIGPGGRGRPGTQTSRASETRA